MKKKEIWLESFCLTHETILWEKVWKVNYLFEKTQPKMTAVDKQLRKFKGQLNTNC